MWRLRQTSHGDSNKEREIEERERKRERERERESERESDAQDRSIYREILESYSVTILIYMSKMLVKTEQL